MFEFLSEAKNEFLGLNYSIDPYNNQPASDPLDPLGLPRNSNLALSPYPQLSELEISDTTDITLIQSIQAGTNLAIEQLRKIALSAEYDEITGLAFGENYNQQAADLLQQSFAQVDLSKLPDIKVISSDILGNANGSYAEELDTIFLSDEFVRSHNTQEIAGVLTEEIGHYIDARINTVDAAGDEGDIFSRLVQGHGLSSADLALLQQEDDTGVITINGQEVTIEKNDTLSTAYNIGTLSGSRSYTDWVGTSDTNDYYRFSVSVQSNFSLALTGLTADADVQLLNSSGTVITSSILSGNSSESINSQLSIGTYYVRVYPYRSANTNYNLSLNATAVVPPDYAGNTLGTARNDIGTLSGSRSFSDWVGTADTNDYYRFSIGTQSNFTLTLNGLTGDADLQLIQDFNNNGIVDSGDVLQGSYNSGATADTISRTLNAGTYFARVYPMSGVNTNYNLSLNATPVSDWYGQNLRDAGIISLTRSLATDGKLSRNDMISIFRDAKDNGVIDANELTDLRTIVTNSNRFAMDDFVRVLSNKIANSDPANSRSGFGNLYAGSSATQMENLIGKWFLGNDRPDAYSIDGATQYTYRSMSGSLFQNGISYQDIKQGNLGDCYFLAGLAGVASRSPSAIQNMFTDNGDGTYTVRFYNNGVADYVTVDRYLPTDANGRLVYANRGDAYNNSANELWVALAEKAYAQMNESGWISRWNNDHNNAYQTRDANYVTNGYQNYTGINGGWSVDVLKQITNQSSTSDWSLTDSDRTNIINQFNAGRTVFMNWAGHALTLVGYNATTQLFSIYNPWGTLYSLNWSQILSGSYDYNPWASGTQSGQRFTDWSYSV